MTDVQRSGWIRRYELDVDAALLAGVRPPILIAGVDQRAEPLGEHVGRDAKVDEARPRNVGGADARARKVDALDDGLRQIARLLAERLGEHHRETGRPIAERRIPRPFDHGFDGVRRAERLRGANEFGAEEFSAVHYLSDFVPELDEPDDPDEPDAPRRAR